jgi:hypothetical protein
LILTDLGSRSVKGCDDPIRVYDAEPTAELTRSLLREAATPTIQPRANDGPQIGPGASTDSTPTTSTPSTEPHANDLLQRGRYNKALAQVAIASLNEPRAVANVSARGLSGSELHTGAGGLGRGASPRTPRMTASGSILTRTQEALGDRQQARITLEDSSGANRDPYVQAWRASFRTAAPGGARESNGPDVAPDSRSRGGPQPGRALKPGLRSFNSRGPSRGRQIPPAGA